MKQIVTYLESRPHILLAICLVMILIAYFTNLGYYPIMADEPTRAIVAMEMIFSGDYIVPTINGELYYNKPPFYNWILASIFNLSGSMSEWAIRLPSIISLMFFGYTIFLVGRHYVSYQVGLMAGIMYVTCGRMLVYSGLLGHIDIFYSWMTFCGFIIVYYFYEQKSYVWLFLLSYTITAIGFLSKGLPSLVFQGVTLLTFFVYQRDWKRLFSWQHILGGLLALGILAVYYGAYFRENPDIDGYLNNLWNESSKRTVLDKAWYESLIHPFTFPFEQIMHLLPWSLFVVFLSRKGIFREFLAHPFLKFCLLILTFNSIPYWLSPETYPRYLFMLYPFVFIFLAFGYEQYLNHFPIYKRILEYVFLGAGCLLAVGVWAALFVESVADVPFRELKTFTLFLGIVASLYFFLKLPQQRFILFALIMMFFRLGFDWFVLPHRYKEDGWRPMKDFGTSIAYYTQGSPLYIFSDLKWDHSTNYYLERERQDIVRRTDRIYPDTYYIGAERHLQDRLYQVHDTLYNRQGEDLYLVTFNQTK